MNWWSHTWSASSSLRNAISYVIFPGISGVHSRVFPLCGSLPFPIWRNLGERGAFAITGGMSVGLTTRCLPLASLHQRCARLSDRHFPSLALALNVPPKCSRPCSGHKPSISSQLQDEFPTCVANGRVASTPERGRGTKDLKSYTQTCLLERIRKYRAKSEIRWERWRLYFNNGVNRRSYYRPGHKSGEGTFREH